MGLISDMLGLVAVMLVAMLIVLAIEGVKLTSDAMKQKRRMKGE